MTNDKRRPARNAAATSPTTPKDSAHTGSFAEIVARLELRERLQAICSEIEHLDADVDVPLTLAQGLLEDVDAEVAR
jgi:transposase